MVPRDRRRAVVTVRASVTRTIAVMAILACSSLCCAAAASAQFGDVTVRLHSAQYFRGGDYTRFVYQVVGTSAPSCVFWILGLCPTAASATWWTSTDITWVEQPLAGLCFTPTLRNQKFYLYLRGAWGVAGTPVGVLRRGAGEPFAVGEIDGPACSACSLSLEIVAGDVVSFLPITGAGVFPASVGTTLRVVSDAADWLLSWSRSFFVPTGADESVVDRILRMDVGEYAATAGTTSVPVSYELRVSESDLADLPEGTYDVSIVYTVTLD